MSPARMRIMGGSLSGFGAAVKTSRARRGGGCASPVFLYTCLAPVRTCLAHVSTCLAPVCTCLAPVCTCLAPVCTCLAPVCTCLAPVCPCLAPVRHAGFTEFIDPLNRESVPSRSRICYDDTGFRRPPV